MIDKYSKTLEILKYYNIPKSDVKLMMSKMIDTDEDIEYVMALNDTITLNEGEVTLMEEYDKITKLLRNALEELQKDESQAQHYKTRIYWDKLCNHVNTIISSVSQTTIKPGDKIKIKVGDTVLEGKVVVARKYTNVLNNSYWWISFVSKSGSYHIWKEEEDGGQIAFINGVKVNKYR
jgi:hypothetical protein